MTHSEIREAVRRFLAVVEGAEPIEDRERALRLSLDRLALASHFAEAPTDPHDHPKPSRPDAHVLRERICALFPYGFYNDVLNVTDGTGAPEFGVGDAIDDLLDIALDMHEVLARWEWSEEDALLHFRIRFMHWGAHLRSLQRYLHALAF